MKNSKPVVTLRANADGIRISKNGKPEKASTVIAAWAGFRSTLPSKKGE